MSPFQGKDLTCVRGERLVFTGLEFRVEAGGALVLTGSNGSGKSSLLRIMAGLLPPAQGALTWDGHEVDEEPEAHRARLHFVGHGDPLKPMLTVSENLGFWAELRTGHRTSKAALLDALDGFGLASLFDLPARFLSAGQRRRANLARLLAAPAPLWLLDEPATALDAASVEALRNVVQRHRADGGLVVASTHADLGLATATVLDLEATAVPVFEPVL